MLWVRPPAGFLPAQESFMTVNAATTKNESQAIRIDGPGQVRDLTLTESTFGVNVIFVAPSGRGHNGMPTRVDVISEGMATGYAHTA